MTTAAPREVACGAEAAVGMATRRGAARPLSVAPMVGHTDRHFRRMMRLITHRTLLYTPMLAPQAVLREGHLVAMDAAQPPVALQLGGSDPALVARAARVAWEAGFDEVNLNLGCPSDAASDGRYGACLMLEPALVQDILRAMREAVPIPVTAKIRLGVDDHDGEEDVFAWVDALAEAGVDRLIVHARKAFLTGLDPKQNRTIPPLRYPLVHAIKARHPTLWVEINGGLKSLAQAREHLAALDGAMIGRAALDDPYLFARADRDVFGVDPPATARTPEAVVQAFVPYAASALGDGEPLARIARGLLTLFNGRPGARAWRQVLSTELPRASADVRVLERALEAWRAAAVHGRHRRTDEVDGNSS